MHSIPCAVVFNTPQFIVPTLLNDRYAKRTSSAKWDQDELTMHEKCSYRNHMGYGGMTPSKPISRPIGRAPKYRLKSHLKVSK